MRVLITGGSGFLGVYFSRLLLSKKCTVTLLDQHQLDASDLIGKVQFIKGDVRDYKIVEKSCKNQDYIVHCAAALPIQQSKDLIYSVNVNGTGNVLKAALKQKVKRVVYISTTAVYKIDQPHPINESGLIEPIGHYGGSKIQAENLCFQYIKKGLSVIIVRPKTFLGPERLGVFEILFDWLYEGRRVPIIGNGKNYYQLLDVNELCQALWLMLKTKYDKEIFNIGAKNFGTVAGDLQYVLNYAKTGARLFYLPALPIQIILSTLEKLKISPLAAWHYKTANIDSYVDCSKAEKMLGWKSKVSGKEVLLSAYKWYAKHRKELEGKTGVTHRVGWNQKILGIVKKFM